MSETVKTDAFRHRLRVRYCETDRQGVTHHGSYVAWFEEARTEWLRARGKSYRQWEEEGFLLQVVAVEMRYLSPTTYDDEIEIEITVLERGPASITFGYDVAVVGAVKSAVVGKTKLVCVNTRRKLCRLPEGF